MRAAVQTRRDLAWDGLARRAGAALAALLAAAAIGLRDIETTAIALGVLLALWLMRTRRGRVGAALLGLLAVDVAVFMAPSAFSNITHGEGFWETALPAALTIAALTTLIASVASLRFAGTETRDVRSVGIAAVVVLAVTLLLASFGVGKKTEARAGDIEIVTEHVAFSDKTIDVQGPDIGVYVANKDLFWHTFTIRQLGVSVSVPVGGERRATFKAGPGTYRFICAVPGHAQAGMKGTLTVR
jgi:plastocyanin